MDVQVTLDGHEDHVFNAYIQELKSDGETAVIFVEELGERYMPCFVSRYTIITMYRV